MSSSLVSYLQPRIAVHPRQSSFYDLPVLPSFSLDSMPLRADRLTNPGLCCLLGESGFELTEPRERRPVRSTLITACYRLMAFSARTSSGCDRHIPRITESPTEHTLQEQVCNAQ